MAGTHKGAGAYKVDRHMSDRALFIIGGIILLLVLALAMSLYGVRFER